MHLQKSITQSKGRMEPNDTACVTNNIRYYRVKGNIS